MAAQIILEFEGIDAKEYAAVNAALGIDHETGKGEWPDGLLTHTGGLNEEGNLVVVEVWNSRDDQARFYEQRLGAALAQGGVTAPPTRVTWVDLLAHHELAGRA